MIRSVEIANFRRFKKLVLKDCEAINIIVGDNGAGKTALLEAIFLTLCNTPHRVLTLRQQRGASTEISGSATAIVESIFSELFHRCDRNRPVKISLHGDGAEGRSLEIEKRPSEIVLPIDSKSTADAEVVRPISFTWTDARKREHTAGVNVTTKGLEFETTKEDLPTWFYFGAQSIPPAKENADRYTELRRSGADQTFIRLIKSIFSWVDEISVESFAGYPLIAARDARSQTMLPLSTISGGVNRVVAILLAMAQRRDGIALIDEIENGLHFSKQQPFAKALFASSMQNRCQLFITTHSREWLENFVTATEDLGRVAFWRIEEVKSRTTIQRFDGATLAAGIRQDTEVRG